MTEIVQGATLKNGKSCEDVQWDVAIWANRNVDRIKLTLLRDASDHTTIDQLASEIFDNADEELVGLLKRLTDCRDSSACKAVYLSALRDALRLIAKANVEFKSHAFDRRLGMYRQLLQKKAFDAIFREPTPVRQSAVV